MLTINVFQFIVSEQQSDQSCSSVQAKIWCPLQVVVGKIEMFELTQWLETNTTYYTMLLHPKYNTDYLMQNIR